MAKAWRPSKAGDGPALPTAAKPAGPSPRGSAPTPTPTPATENERALLTCVAPRDIPRCRPTHDPYDRAHARRVGSVLLPAASPMPSGVVVLAGSRPRIYHPSQLVGPVDREVGVDSMFDSTHERVAALARDGVDSVGDLGVPPSGWAMEARARAFAGMSRAGVRRLIGESVRGDV